MAGAAFSWRRAWACDRRSGGGPTLAPRLTGSIAAAIIGVLGVSALLSSGWQAFREHRIVAGLPSSAANARNVVLIVWDTVRAYNLSLYGYSRRTTPYLERWARKGVIYRVRAGACSVDIPVALDVLHRAMALEDQFPDGSSFLMPPTPRWLNI